MLTNRQTDRQTDKHGSKHYPTTSVGGNYREVKVRQTVLYSLEECRRGARLPSLGCRFRRWLYITDSDTDGQCDPGPTVTFPAAALPLWPVLISRPADLEAALIRVSCHTPRRDGIRSPISVLTGLDVE